MRSLVKAKQLNIRLTREQQARLKQAAALRGMRPSQFVREKTMEAVEQVLAAGQAA